MSDDGLILSVIAAIGLFGVMLMPPTSDPQMAGPDHSIRCEGNDLSIKGIEFDRVWVSISCKGSGKLVTLKGDYDVVTIQYNIFAYPARHPNGQ